MPPVAVHVNGGVNLPDTESVLRPPRDPARRLLGSGPVGDPDPAHRQSSFAVRMEWGPTGAEAIVDGCDVAVVVDVLSFTTTVGVALDRGARVIPCRWRDERAVALAREHDAVLAVGRAGAGPGDVSLSPVSVRSAGPFERLVLPSPNGSTISTRLAGRVPTVVAASLRNRSAVARWIRARPPGTAVAVVAAGERWPDGSLRPALEDQWGAGALLALLGDGGSRRDGAAPPDSLSPEARAAATAFAAVADDVGAHLRACASGRELIDAGHPGDVDVAAELDASSVVPVLVDGIFEAADP